MALKWNGEDSLSVIVPETFKNEVEGMCGSFDDNDGNDFAKPNGEQVIIIINCCWCFSFMMRMYFLEHDNILNRC